MRNASVFFHIGRYALKIKSSYRVRDEKRRGKVPPSFLKFDFFFDVFDSLVDGNTDLFHRITVTNGNGVVL